MSRPFAKGALATLVLAVASAAHAHVHWTQVNQYDASAIAMYHLNDTVFTTGSPLAVEAGWASNRNLTIQAPTGTGFSSAASGPDTFFGTALRLDGAQRADSVANFGYDDPAYAGPDLNGSLPGDNSNGPGLVDKDLTIEFWMKWEAAPTASALEIGLRSGAKLQIVRDTATPANDRFAILATHGTFVSAPGFTNWDAVGAEEAPLDEWIHVAVAIDSTGSTFDVPSSHYRYNAGSVARFYLNGHAVGTAPHTVALDGVLDFHSESSVLTIRNVSGVATVDEVAIWAADLSQGGTVAGPFANGRGTGVTSVADWQMF